jgi:BirA family biotin operon repressor/biotin-[acetyl-CoA-carboxylase] ligase
MALAQNSMKNTLFVGKVLHHYAELGSTNDFAAQLLHASKSRPAEGTVVRADSQSAGRGQFGSRWDSAAGLNLTLSVIFYPQWLQAQEQFQLSMAVALALRHTAQTLLGDATAPGSTCLKWPNDLYIGDRKTAGILIQNTLSGTKIQASIVGIGLNVNQLDFDPTLPNPGSLALAKRQALPLDEVQETLFADLESAYLRLRSGQDTGLQARYEAALYRRGIPSRFERLSDGSTLEGTIEGVAPDGQLRLQTAQGTLCFEPKMIRLVAG